MHRGQSKTLVPHGWSEMLPRKGYEEQGRISCPAYPAALAPAGPTAFRWLSGGPRPFTAAELSADGSVTPVPFTAPSKLRELEDSFAHEFDDQRSFGSHQRPHFL